MSAEFIVAVIGFVLLILAWAVLPVRHTLPLSETEEQLEAAPVREPARMRRGNEATA